MSIIPIIGDVIDLMKDGVTWVLYVAPPYLKLAIFFAILTFSVTILATVFNVLHINHRILQPEECATVYSLQEDSTTFDSQSECDTLSDCITTNNNDSCYCGCLELTNANSTPEQACGCGEWDIPCILGCGVPTSFQYRLTCSQNSFGWNIDPNRCESNVISTEMPNMSVLSFCSTSLGGESLHFSQQIAKCANEGVDFLDSKVLFVATMVTFLGGFALAYRRVS